MSAPAADERAHAVASADRTCPRCGTARAEDQRYCLECGLALPVVSGRLPSLRRRWIRRFGWYPGDWVWAALATLLVAAAGAAAAIAVSDARDNSARHFAVAPPVSVGEPAGTVQSSSGPARAVDTSKLPTAPEPGTSAPGRTAWPAGESGWTIVLVSYPKTFGRSQALQTARKAAKARLAQAGVIDSSRYASLQPGYFVVFAGIYASKEEADAAVATARQAGFGGAYSRQIAR
ncbi:MAG TPA: SPOR domain-containing protein [Gaiellaceae bacterium]|nr:SPOR domain-containing protein [Gaiellaceae bacterium]